MFRRGVLVVLLVACLAACGHASDAPDDVISAGQLDIKLPPGWKVTEHGVSRPAAPVGDVASSTAGGTTDTVPLAEEDPTTSFFEATSSFTQCLKDRGTSFLGVPGQGDPNGPANDPTYVKDLSTCAAKSNILQAMQGAQKAQESMSPAEIKQQNKAYLKWRKCMIGRGWDIAEPKPDSKGRLFSFSQGTGAQMTPPDGEDLLTSGDLQECAAQTQDGGGKQ
jgi:hypothetical protein